MTSRGSRDRAVETLRTRVEGGIALVSLNRPAVLNALDLDMASSLAQTLLSLADDRIATAVVIGGEGRAFCAGGDLRWAQSSPAGAGTAFRQLATSFHRAVTAIRRMPKPVIAAIQGVAAGGGLSLALACDFRVMARSAVLRQAYTSSGLCIDGGGTFNLPRLVGLARALEIAAFDEPIAANQAFSWGLVTEVVEDDAVLPAALSLARKLSSRSSNAFALSKRLMTESFETSFETQLERELEGLVAAAQDPEGREGVAAFLEKRPPGF